MSNRDNNENSNNFIIEPERPAEEPPEEPAPIEDLIEEPAEEEPTEPVGEQFPEIPAMPFIQRKEYYSAEKEINRIWYLIIGVLIFVVVTFITIFYLIVSDFIKEKELLLKYYDVYQSYSQDNLKLRDRINEQKIEIGNLWKEIELLRVKNPYLK